MSNKNSLLGYSSDDVDYLIQTKTTLSPRLNQQLRKRLPQLFGQFLDVKADLARHGLVEIFHKLRLLDKVLLPRLEVARHLKKILLAVDARQDRGPKLVIHAGKLNQLECPPAVLDHGFVFRVGNLVVLFPGVLEVHRQVVNAVFVNQRLDHQRVAAVGVELD